MSLLKNIDKLLATFGNKSSIERIDLDEAPESFIQNIGGDRIATSEDIIIHAGIDDLNGYLFLETLMLSRVNIKSMNGATLKFEGQNNFKLSSDTQEIKSEFSSESNRFMTKVSFDITEKEIKHIKNGKYGTVTLEFKKKSYTMKRPENIKSKQ